MRISDKLLQKMYYESVDQFLSNDLIRFAINNLLFEHLPLDEDQGKDYRNSIAQNVIMQIDTNELKEIHKQMAIHKGTPLFNAIVIKQENLIARAIFIATQYDDNANESMLRAEVQNETAIQSRIQNQIDNTDSRSLQFNLNKAQKELEQIKRKLPFQKSRLEKLVQIKILTKQIQKILLIQE